MNRFGVACVLACAAAVFGGCAKNGATAAGDARSDLFEPVSKLAGDWYMKDEQGKEHLAMQFRVTSAGTVVREIMFPGEGHEMTNMYHRDGGDLVVTHYCAAGNQPRMRARGMADEKMEFKFDSITNRKTAGEEYMGEMTLNFTGPNTMVEEWWSYKEGKREQGPKFKLYRKPGRAMGSWTADLVAMACPTADPRIDGERKYVVDRFLLQYEFYAEKNPELRELFALPIKLGVVNGPDGLAFVAPRDGVPTVSCKIGDFFGEGGEAFYTSGIGVVATAIADALNTDKNAARVFVAPHPDDIGWGMADDKRVGRRGLRLAIFTGSIRDVRTAG